MPRELSRTNSFAYTIYNLEALALVCEIGHANDVDLWNYTHGERSISKAIDYILPTLRNPYNPPNVWKHKQIDPVHQTDKLFLHFGAIRLKRPELARLNKSLSSGMLFWRQRYLCPLCIMEGYKIEHREH